MFRFAMGHQVYQAEKIRTPRGDKSKYTEKQKHAKPSISKKATKAT
jgi:hypothetical protein